MSSLKVEIMTGLCYICGRIADNVCSMCGRVVCDADYDKESGTCKIHKKGRKIEHVKK
jgi:hypothetical protein